MNDDRLTQHLQHVADKAPLRHLEMEDVMHRAQGIKRKRRTAAAAGLAVAAVLIAVPVGIGVFDNRGPREGGPVDTPSVTPSGTPAPPVTPGTLDLTKLSRGEAPKVAYVEGTTLHLVDGVLNLPRKYDQVVVLPQVVIGKTLPVEPVTEFDIIDRETGKVLDSQAGWGSGPVVNAEQTMAAFLDVEQRPVVVSGKGHLDRLPAFDGDHAPGDGSPAHVLFLQGESCLEGDAEGATGCAVFANLNVGSSGSESALKVSNSHGFMDTAPTDFDFVIGTDVRIADGSYQAIGYSEIRDDGSCSVLVAEGSTSPLWKTCDFATDSFGPGNRLVLGGPAYRSGLGDGQVALLDARTGKPVVDFRTERDSHINSVVWEDAEHVLAQVYKDGKWAIVRLGADGSTELATAPVAGEDMEAPYRLAGQR